ncbi:gibberellin 3-beta hydroxylase [Hypoxylon cercidicola]|nr:gibberellin 3-beta hydroxylase [Hypoxylon cercidicola]
MAAPFVPPKSTHAKPHVPEWVPPPTTKLVTDWAHVTEVDLSKLDSEDPEVVKELIATTKKAIKEDGFIYLTNYGISLQDLHRQFSLAQYLHRNISEEDKERLIVDIKSGKFAGWKGRHGFVDKNAKNNFDGIEQFNFYREEFANMDARVPEIIKPFMDEIVAFCEYLTQSVNRRLLTLLSRVLELPDDYLWDHVQGHGGPVNDGYFRHALFHPLESDVKERMAGIRMMGHTDYGTTTMLFSVPVTALQICPKRDGNWKYVKYNPGALVINLGEALEIVSAGQFKATLHKVAQPPADQENTERLSIVLFNAAKSDLQLKPFDNSPLIQREGYNLTTFGVFTEFHKAIQAGMAVPNCKDWREHQIARKGQSEPQKKNGTPKIINGVKFWEDTYMGVKVLLPA